ncbi:C-terminal binding protein [bacterium]|nr:C-terminal binding protein [bacterium]
MYKIAVVDWATSPRGDEACEVERSVLDGQADVTYGRVTNGDMSSWDKLNIYDADLVTLWHNVDMPKEVISKFKKLKGIVRNGTGYDSVDHKYARAQGIEVSNVPNYGTEEVADHSIALALALCRQILPIDQECKRLGWEIPNKHVIRRFQNMNFGVVGLGRIGTSVALKAKALGFTTWFYDPYLSNGVDKSLGLHRCKNWDEFLSSMDVISINCPLTEETHHMFTHKEFKKMKDLSFLVNTARGPIVNKADCLAALRHKQIAGAALDVIEDEPLKTEKEASCPNLIATCHSAFYSVQAAYEMKNFAAEEALRLLEGHPENVVN